MNPMDHTVGTSPIAPAVLCASDLVNPTPSAHFYVASRSLEDVFLVSGPYPDLQDAFAAFERVKSLACAHSPAGRSYRWGCLELAARPSPPLGLLERELGYTLTTARHGVTAPLHRGLFDALCHEIRVRGFDTVLTSRGPVALRGWQPFGPFESAGKILDGVIGGFEWVGPNLIQSVPCDPGHSGLGRVWTLATRAAHPLELGPIVASELEWRVILGLERTRVFAEWRPCGTRPWHSAEDWTHFDPESPTRNLPSEVWHLIEEWGLPGRYARHVRGSAFLTTEVLESPFATGVEGTWHEIANEWGSLHPRRSPEEQALCRWMTRAQDVEGDEALKLENFLTQRWSREELAQFLAEVKYLHWPHTWGKSPWSTAEQVARCVERDEPEGLAPAHLGRLAERIWDSLRVRYGVYSYRTYPFGGAVVPTEAQSRVSRGPYRYRLLRTHHSSGDGVFDPCQICRLPCDDVYEQLELQYFQFRTIGVAHEGWNDHGRLYGHRACLESSRKTPQESTCRALVPYTGSSA